VDNEAKMATASVADDDDSTSRSLIRIYLDVPPRTSAKGPRYTARLGSPFGELLVRDSLVPFCDTARVLLARGVQGGIEMWDPERPFPRLRGLIEDFARLTVREDERTGPQFVPWRPFPAARERSRTADRPAKLPQHARTETPAGEREILT
jgi:hypothetical protein